MVFQVRPSISSENAASRPRTGQGGGQSGRRTAQRQGSGARQETRTAELEGRVLCWQWTPITR